MDINFNFKELYQTALKTTLPIEINKRIYEAGEVITVFDSIQILNLQEIKDRTTARGGYQNSTLITWESTDEIQLLFSQGVFSTIQFGLMSNSELETIEEEVIIFEREYKETNEEGKIELKELPSGAVFIYNRRTGEKLDSFTLEEKTIDIGEPFLDVVVDYHYKYLGGGTKMIVGRRLTEGFLELEGRTSVKDDETGQVKTGVLRIPKLKLMSDLSMRLGKDPSISPIVANFEAIGYPVGVRGNRKVMEMFFLENDIDSDI